MSQARRCFGLAIVFLAAALAWACVGAVMVFVLEIIR